jgi:ribosomal protein S18 acetylase RimI-like enzyme
VALTEYEQQGYRISTESEAMDLDAVHAYLARSYWAREIPKDLVAKAFRGSLCFGLFKDDCQIGFARVVTDRSTFAYLCDVYVLEDYRGRGLGVWLMDAVLAHPDLQALRRFVLATRDAHGLYERYGFSGLARPEIFMEINRPDMYATKA